MKHIVKIMAILLAVTAVWISLLQNAVIPRSHTWLLPLYFIVSLGCYGLLMVGVGLMQFPTCPHEAVLLQQVFCSICLRLRRVSFIGITHNFILKFASACFHCYKDVIEAKEFLKHKGVDVGSD